MRALHRIFAVGFGCIVILFGLCGFALIAFASLEFWHAVNFGEALSLTKRFNTILKCIAMLTIAIAALELGLTVLEEEFKRERKLSEPERIRRILGRFLIVVVVSLAIESLVATFQYVHDDPSMLVQTASIAFAAAALLVAWAIFLKLTKSAEHEDKPNPAVPKQQP